MKKTPNNVKFKKLSVMASNEKRSRAVESLMSEAFQTSELLEIYFALRDPDFMYLCRGLSTLKADQRLVVGLCIKAMQKVA